MSWEEKRAELVNQAVTKVRHAAELLGRSEKQASDAANQERSRLTKLAGIYTKLKYVDLCNAVLFPEELNKEAAARCEASGPLGG